MNDRKCIFILADGARADLFEYLLSRGDLPNISRYIVDRGSYVNGVSVFPSTTGPAYLPYLLGKFPGRCNLPGIRWFDRKEYGTRKFSLNRFRSYIGLETYLINSDIHSSGVPTLFELFPDSVSILNEITRGINSSGDRTRFRKIYYKMKSHFTGGCDEVDEASGRILLNSLRSSPDLIFAVFMGVDTYSHQLHPYHKSVIDSYTRIDKYIGLAGDYLRREGKLDDTLIILGSDHGLTSTHTHFDSLGFLRKFGYKPLYYPNIFRHLLNADASNMVSGNSMAHMYFKNDSGWHEPTNIEEIENIVDDLVSREEVDMVMGVDEDKNIVIRSESGEARTRMEDGKIRFDVVSGNPLGMNLESGIYDPYEQLVRTFDTKYPDVLLQIIQLFESARTGDIVISAGRGYDLRAGHESPEHRSSHGSLDRDHIMVPLAINKPVLRKFVRTVDIYPTIVKFLGKEIPENIDGIDLLDNV